MGTTIIIGCKEKCPQCKESLNHFSISIEGNNLGIYQCTLCYTYYYDNPKKVSDEQIKLIKQKEYII